MAGEVVSYEDDDTYAGSAPCRRCGGPRISADEKRHPLGWCALCDPKGTDDELPPAPKEAA